METGKPSKDVTGAQNREFYENATRQLFNKLLDSDIIQPLGKAIFENATCLLTVQIESLKEELGSITTERDSLKQERDWLKGELATARGQVVALENKIAAGDDVQKRFSSVIEQKNAYRTRVEELEERVGKTENVESDGFEAAPDDFDSMEDDNVEIPILAAPVVGSGRAAVDRIGAEKAVSTASDTKLPPSVIGGKSESGCGFATKSNATVEPKSKKTKQSGSEGVEVPLQVATPTQEAPVSSVIVAAEQAREQKVPSKRDRKVARLKNSLIPELEKFAHLLIENEEKIENVEFTISRFEFPKPSSTLKKQGKSSVDEAVP